MKILVIQFNTFFIIIFWNKLFFDVQNKFIFWNLNLYIEMKFINILNKIALHIAVENNNSEFVKLLLGKQDIDINNKYVLST